MQKTGSAEFSGVSTDQLLKALRQIEYMLGRQEFPTARACGLTETEFRQLANQRIIEVVFSEDKGPILDRYHVRQILPTGFATLTRAQAEESLAHINSRIQQPSQWSQIIRVVGAGLWDVLKIVLGVLGTTAAAWLIWKHHWK